jgi:hypothetical protein
LTTRRAFSNLLMALTLLTWGAGPAAAASADGAAADGELPPGLKMTSEAALDGYVKFGEWLAVWVELENSGPDLEAQIRVRITSGGGATIFGAPASLPAGSRKRIPLYVLPNNFTHELEVQLVQGSQVLTSQKLATNPRTSNTYMIGLVAPERGALALLQGVSLPGDRPKELIDVSLATLPERVEGLRSLDCLILNDVDTSLLRPEQQAAIEAWVNQGGRLVIGGGAGAARTAAGLPASLLPLVPRTVTEIDTVAGLEEMGGAQAIRVPGPFVVAGGEPGDGQILAEQDELPLVVEQAVGSGYADLVALDLAHSPFDAWSGATSLWERLLSPGAAYPPWLPIDASPRQMRMGSLSYALSNLPSLDLPSVQGLAVLLIVYILLVGPANYAVLRWRKRLQWAWITIPLLTVIFSGGAFGLAYAMHGTDLILNKIAIVELQPGGRASLSSYVGLFSPSQQSYEIQVAGSGLLSPLAADYNPWGPGGLNTVGEMVFMQGDPSRVSGLTVNQWSMQTFAVESLWTDFGQILGDLQAQDQTLVGTIRNETPYRLTDVALILGNDFVKLGDLAPGEQAKVEMELAESNNTMFGSPVTYRLFEEQTAQSGPTGPARIVQIKQSVLQSVFEPSGWSGKLASSSLSTGTSGGDQKNPILIAWLDQAPPEVRVNDRNPVERITALVYAPLSVHFSETGWVTVPPGLIGGAVVEMPMEGGTCGTPGTTAIYMGRGQAVFEFRLPEEMSNLQADELTLLLASDGGWALPSGTAIYDWDARAWKEFDNIALGANVISGARNLVSADGLVRVRLSSDGGSSGCYALDLGVKGIR